MSKLAVRLAIICLALSHITVLFAEFFAPYGYAEQNRDVPYLPPCPVHVFRNERLVRPYFYPRRVTSTGAYIQDRSTPVPIRFFVHGSRYALFDIIPSRFSSDLHLMGADGNDRFFLLGTDGYGRDQLSRLIFGGRISLLAGLFAAALALLLGSILGAVAGMGGWIDDAVMRLVEIFLSVPTLYLLFAARAAIPLRAAPGRVYFVLIAIIGLTGWARPARLVRGAVLSLKEREFVAAARAFGGSEFYVFRRHILPLAAGIVLTQFTVLIPQYMLAEVTLSFVGLGVDEPAASWGNMLVPLQQYAVLDSCWWMFAPACAAMLITLAYYVLSSTYKAGEAC